MAKVQIIKTGTVEKLASVAPVFSARTVILHIDRLIFTRGIGTVNAPKEVRTNKSMALSEFCKIATE